MRPADETPTSGHQADALKHIHENLQAPPPGTPGKPESPFLVNTGRNATADLSDLYNNYISQPTEENRGELMQHCEKFLEKKICYYVHCRGLCPAHAPSTFEEDALSRAKNNYWTGIHNLRNAESLKAWLTSTARYAVIDEIRKVRGRTDEPYSWGPLEVEYPDGSVRHVLDRVENRDAATRYGCITVEHTQFVKQLVYQDVLGKMFRVADTCSRRQQEGIALLKMMLAHDLTAEEIAIQYGMKRAHVLTLLHRARKKLREIAETKLMFAAEDL